MKQSKRWLLLAVAMLALAGVLVRSILTNPQWRAFSADAFVESLLSVDKGWLGWALVSIYATYLVRALRWKILMGRIKPNARLRNIFSATVIGFAAIGVFGRAGEMVRPYLVARKEAVPVSSQLAVWVLERALDTLIVLVTVAFALRNVDAAGLRSSPTLSRALHVSGNLVAFTVIGIVVLVIGLGAFTERLTPWLLERLRFLSAPRFRKIEHGLVAFLEGARGIHGPAALVNCTLYSLAEWALVAFCYVAVFNSFSAGLRLSLGEIFIFMGAVMAGSAVQIPGIGGGVQVASLLVLTEIFAVRPELAASISLLIWAFTFLVVVPPAVFLVFYEGLSWSKLTKLESENET